MDYYERIQKSIDFIEQNLDEHICIKQISEQAYFSVTHFYRIFQAMVGDTVKEYIRKRRLSKSAYELLSTNKKIIDIAFNYHFESQEAFTRAFSKMYGTTPGKYRKNCNEIILYEKANVCERKIYIDGGIIMEPKIVMKNEFKVIGFEITTTHEDDIKYNHIPKFWDKFLKENLLDRIPNKTNPNSYYGISTELDGDTDKFSYIICTEVSSFENIPDGAIKRLIQANKYAVFTAKGQPIPEKISDTWNYIFNSWLPKSGYELSDGEFFELFDERCTNTDSSEVDIYVPIR